MKLLILAALAASLSGAAIAGALAGDDHAGRQLTLAQFQDAQWKHLQRADTDGDGRISAAEFAAMAAARGHADRADKAFSRLDADGDGFLSRAEADKLAARRFSRLDADHDGQVTATERQAAHVARAGVARQAS
jgi:Ca2+-binding EF-hand superfamily protein